MKRAGRKEGRAGYVWWEQVLSRGGPALRLSPTLESVDKRTPSPPQPLSLSAVLKVAQGGRMAFLSIAH